MLETSFGLTSSSTDQYYNNNKKKTAVSDGVLMLYFKHNGMSSTNNNIIIVYITTVSLCTLCSFCLVFPLILMLKYFGVSCLILHILLNKRATFVFRNFSLKVKVKQSRYRLGGAQRVPGS